MSKNDAIRIINNSNLNKKMNYDKFFLSCIKMSETTCYQRSREAIPNRAKD